MSYQNDFHIYQRDFHVLLILLKFSKHWNNSVLCKDPLFCVRKSITFVENQFHFAKCIVYMSEQSTDLTFPQVYKEIMLLLWA